MINSRHINITYTLNITKNVAMFPDFKFELRTKSWLFALCKIKPVPNSIASFGLYTIILVCIEKYCTEQSNYGSSRRFL